MLTNRIPYPLKDGGSLAMHYFIEGYLEAGVKLSLLSMQTTRHFVDLNKLPLVYGKLSWFKTIEVDNAIKPLDALLNLFSSKSYHIARFESKKYEQALIEVLQRESFDYIQLESLFLTPYVSTIRKYSNAKIILRSHNIEYLIWKRLSIQTQQPLKKWYLKLLAKRLEQYELAHLNDYDIILPISDNDKKFYKEHQTTATLHTISFGIRINNLFNQNVLDINAPHMKIYHLGAMDWLPNIEGVIWLVKEVMPKIRAAKANITLHLAGRNMSNAIKDLAAPDIIIDGEVDNAMLYESDKHILCVPLLSGGGVRIKIFEALAQGKAVVTTTVGSEGIKVVNKKDILVAYTAQEFAEHILFLYHNRQAIESIGQSGQQVIKNQYNRDQQIKDLLDFLNKHS